MPADRPNIVLMISHDLGRHIGPYGHALTRCPRLSALAADSIRLDSHFVSSPGCSQSRSSLMTGRYPHSNGQFGLSHLGWTLCRDELLLPAVLGQAGYRTALRGIWHLADWTLRSFDDVSSDASTVDSSPEGYAQVAADRAVRWLGEHGGEARPFYLHIGFWEAHRPFCGHLPTPVEPDPSVAVPPYLPPTQAARREFDELHRSIDEIDAAVGRILDELARLRLDRRTIVIFTADHGLPFPRAKGTLYDPGIAVAFLIRWCGRLAPGARADLTSNLDVMPTLLEAASIPVPPRVQGRSFLPTLRDGREHRSAIFAEKTYHEHYDPIRCVRTDRHKLIRNFAPRPMLVLPSDVYNSPTRRSMTADESLWAHRPPVELYDLRADPDESRNLADDPAFGAVRADLYGRLDEWMTETNDPLRLGPIPRPSPAGASGM
jgi:arylsulfatase A-like enzyme